MEMYSVMSTLLWPNFLTWRVCLFLRPYLNANKREALADYALPVAVIVLSFIGSYVFRDVKRKSLQDS